MTRWPRGRRQSGGQLRRVIGTGAALAVLGLIDCTDPGSRVFEVTPEEVFSASVQTTALLGGPYPDLAVSGTQDTVRISWWIGTGSPCYAFGAGALARLDTLVATVVASQAPAGCTAVVAGFAYTVTVSGVVPGLTTLRLVHELLNRSDTSLVTVAIRPLGGP
jgi:hypothetical protein